MADKPRVNRSWKTVKPSGVTITRSDDWFILSWKIADEDYGRGQTVTYEAEVITWSTVSVTDKKTKKVTKTTQYKTSKGSGSYFLNNSSYNGKRSLGAKTTELWVKLDTSKFYPASSRYLSKVIFKIQARRNKFEKETNTEISVYDPTVSDWVTSEWVCAVPNNVKTLTNSVTAYNQSKFSWEITYDKEMKQWFKQWEYESILLKNSVETDGSKVNFTANGTTRIAAIAITRGTALTGERYVTEDTTAVGWGTTDTYTRWMRMRTRGPRGNCSAWRYAKHVYARPKSPTNLSGTATVQATTSLIHLHWQLDVIANRPVDHVKAQYCIAIPTGTNMYPSDEGWADSPAGEMVNTNTWDGVNFLIPNTIDKDYCLWARAVAYHDTYESPSSSVLLYKAPLTAPSDFRVEINTETHVVTAYAQNNSQHPSSNLFVKYYDTTSYPQGFIIARMYHQEEHVTFQCPNWGNHSVHFEVFAAVVRTENITTSKLKADQNVTVYTIKPEAQSGQLATGGSVPSVPTGVALKTTEIPGTINVTWKWSTVNWDYAEISWADHEDAWRSTSPPQTQELKRIETPSWNISGLDINKDWYVRMRFGDVANEGETRWGGYSATQKISLSVAPDPPILYLADSIVRSDGSVKAYWTYYSGDGTSQKTADIYEYAEVNGSPKYTKLYQNTTVQSRDIYPKAFNWKAGETHQIVLRVTSSANLTSDWSDPITLTVAEPIDISILEDSLDHDVVMTSDEAEDAVRTANVLTEMPLTLKVDPCWVSVNGNETEKLLALGTITASISRLEDYYLDRPDESEFVGYAGEIVALKSGPTSREQEFVFESDELIGYLDDGAKYQLLITVADIYGQSASTSMDFEVHWDHQALKPLGSVTLNGIYDVAELHPIAPVGALESDVCDIYRLSTDKPELIYTNATFGDTYIDPYPTVGYNGGYRFVFKTKNNDYITADNEIAWLDMDFEFDDIYQHIDFGEDSVTLLYNVDLSSNWSKDFKEQKYLGGSIQGDWNAAVSRTGSVSGVVVTTDDQNTIEKMRRLAVYPGICRVRTRDGSNYTANVNVSESRGYEPTDLVTSFTLNVTKVDPEELSGMTFEEWAEYNDDELRTHTVAYTTYNEETIGDYEITLDTEVVDAKQYYERSGSGTEDDPYVYTPVEEILKDSEDNILYVESFNNSTSSGITWHLNNDGTVSASGTATAATARTVLGSDATFPEGFAPGGKYWIIYNAENIQLQIRTFKDGTAIQTIPFRSPGLFEIDPEAEGISFRYLVSKNVTLDETAALAVCLDTSNISPVENEWYEYVTEVVRTVDKELEFSVSYMIHTTDTKCMVLFNTATVSGEVLEVEPNWLRIKLDGQYIYISPFFIGSTSITQLSYNFDRSDSISAKTLTLEIAATDEVATSDTFINVPPITD